MFSGLIGPDLAIAAVAAFLAGIIRGYGGFGTPLMMAPVFAILYGPYVMLALVSTLEIIVIAITLREGLRHWQMRTVLPLAFFTLIGIPIGLMVLDRIDPQTVRRLIAGMVLVAVAVLATGWRYPGPRPAAATAGVGLLAGILTGITSIGGPPVIAYLLAGKDSIQVNRANLIVFFAFLTSGALAAFTLRGMLTWEVLARAVLLAPTLIMGLFLGTRMFYVTSPETFRRVALTMLACAGLYALLA